jgi:hypothetical protein
MLGFIIIIGIAAVVGVQMGVFVVLRDKGIGISRAVFYSFLIYFIPLILAIVYYDLYKERHSLLEEARKELNLNGKQYAYLKKRLDSVRFKFMVIKEGIVDMLTPKDNILVLTRFAVEYDRKYVTKRVVGKKSMFEKIGVIGVFKKAFSSVSDSMKDHAKNETIIKRYAH